MLYAWHKVENLSASLFSENKVQELTVSGKKVGLIKRNGHIHAFAALCPHAGAPLCEGWVDPMGRIVCPLHKYRFDPANGRNTSGEGYKLFTYPVEIKNDEIFIGLLS